MIKKNWKLIVILGFVATLQGCAAAFMGGSLAAVSSLNDKRTIGTQLDDESIELSAEIALSKNDALREHAHLNVISFNRVALLVGQVESEHLKDVAEKVLKQQANIRAVHNFIRVAELAPIGTRTKDLWITSKVKAQLVNEKDIDGLNVKVTTEDSEVFLMGLLDKNEADRAVEIARRVNGVSRVVKLFEYL
jgi:osmotically-inducible protein OsmY